MTQKSKFNTEMFRQRRKRLDNPTPAEESLRRELRERGIRYEREAPMFSRYFADFFFRDARVAVEVDGPCHAKRKEQDRKRDEPIASRNIVVLRFTNEEVISEPSSVVDRIVKKIEERGSQRINPHP